MEYKVLDEKVYNTINNILDGYVFKVAVVSIHNGRMLKFTLNGISFFTNTKWLAIHRHICGNELKRLQRDITTHYGYDCDISKLHTKGIFADYALFDVENIWDSFGYIPTQKMNLFQFFKSLKSV